MDVLFASPDEMRARQSRHLRDTFALLVRGHEYVRSLGVAAGDVRGVDDLARLPILDKDAYVIAPRDFVLELPALPLGERTLHDVLYTTGTTREPAPFFNTVHDYFASLAIAERVVELIGITADDTIANLYPLGPLPHLTWHACSAYAMVSGARLASALTGAGYPPFDVTRPMEWAVELVERSGATLLWGMPSFVRRVLRLAAERGADFSRVRMAAVSGEPTPAPLRADLIERLAALGARAPRVNDRFGFTEMASVMVECSADGEGGFHLVAPDHFFLEVVDEEGRPVADGESGRLLITHLQRRGTVLLRYATGDVVRLSHEPCPACGRTCPRVTSPRRSGDRLLVKGTLVDPRLLFAELARLTDLVEYQIVVTRREPDDPLSEDHLRVRVALATVDESVTAEIAALVRRLTEVTPEIELATAGDIWDPSRDAKPRRLVDLR